MTIEQTIRTVDLPCTGCGARDDEMLYEGREHEYDTTDKAFPVVRCRECGLVRLNPRPDISELARIYPPNYYAYHLTAGANEGQRLRVTDRLKALIYRRRLKALLSSLNQSETIRLLDIGCADGRLLDWYRSSPGGSRIETHGIEMNESAAEVARRSGHRVVIGRFEDDTELEAGAFDLILASHVIEHVADPHRFAARAAQLLVPGGLFVVSTPNVDSVDVRWFHRCWGGNHFPRHWTFYDASTIGILANSVGLGVERVDYDVNPIFWNWTMHAYLRDRFPHSAIADRLFPPVAIFESGLRNVIVLSLFTAVDVILRICTGRTASMSVRIRRPRSAGTEPPRGHT